MATRPLKYQALNQNIHYKSTKITITILRAHLQQCQIKDSKYSFIQTGGKRHTVYWYVIVRKETWSQREGQKKTNERYIYTAKFHFIIQGEAPAHGWSPCESLFSLKIGHHPPDCSLSSPQTICHSTLFCLEIMGPITILQWLNRVSYGECKKCVFSRKADLPAYLDECSFTFCPPPGSSEGPLEIFKMCSASHFWNITI